MPLLSYWDEEELEASPPRASVGEAEEITTAAPGPVVPRQPQHSSQPERRFDLRTSGPSAVSLFWWSFLALCMLGLVLPSLMSPDSLLVGAFIIALTLPAFQLGGGLVAALILALSGRSDKGYQFRKLGQILLGMVAGTMIGWLVMVVLVALFAGPGALSVIAPYGAIPALFLVLSVVWLRALTGR
jgi:hypothetical protein